MRTHEHAEALLLRPCEAIGSVGRVELVAAADPGELGVVLDAIEED